MGAPANTLYILRHAKSAWDSDAADDFSRPLNKRGERDAPGMGKWMRKQGYVPQCIISSPAQRARQTVSAVCTALHIDQENIVFDRQCYLAGVETLLRILNTVPATCRSLLLVGHNPGLEQLTSFLLGKATPTFADGKLLPTAALCVIELPSWSSLSAGVGQLRDIQRVKEID